MTKDDRDTLEVLKAELNFLEKGGYGRSVKAPWQPTSIFQDSPSCLNFSDAQRSHPCGECLLIDFVPQEARTENVPCHHIPLTPAGTTIDTLETDENQAQLEETMRTWLRSAIEKLENAKAVQQGT